MLNRILLISLSISFAYGICDSVQADDVRFNRDIRPILSENCFFCHGPDSAKREAGLRLDDEDAAKEAAIVAGDVEASELIARIISTDPDVRMPPPESGREISPEQIETLKQWINDGAAYESHWSFIAPNRPIVPADPAQWSRQPIDNFVLAKMKANKLLPAPETDRATWLRRVTFDLTGLPPTIEELDAFEKDESPHAYEQRVDRLLASPRFGERMTADWLDVARYSDSYGMQVDKDRRVFPYRDWIIRAFNRDMSYDQFIMEQIAGDLLPGATRDQILATTFNRLHPQEAEGGSVPEEFRIEYVADRTQTVATAMLGLTMECCRCHDHKYDPLSQKDYYALSSFFDNIDEAGLYSYFTDSCPTPTLDLPSDEQAAAIEAAAGEVAKAESELSQTIDSRRDAFDEWLKSQVNHDAVIPESPTPPVHVRDFEDFESKTIKTTQGKLGQRAALFEGDDGLDFGVGNFDRWQPFSIALWMKTPDVKDRAVVFHRSRAWTDAASRGYELLIDEGHLQASMIHFWPGNAVSVRAQTPLAIDQWVHVTMVSDGSGKAEGLTIFVDGKRAETTVVRDALTKQIAGGGGDNITIAARFRDRGFTGGSVDQFTVFDREISSLEAARLHNDGFRIDTKLTNDEAVRATLFAHFITSVDRDCMNAKASLVAARRRLFERQDSVPEIMVMREGPQRRQSYLLARGAYDARAEPVSPATPSTLPGLAEESPRDRLGLAQWLVDERNPLVARVAVNRLWQLMFSRGLVATPEDFGSQGLPPSHPELLDWLAVEFRESGWDVKSMLKMISLSSTYRQSSPPLDPRDPENIYLSRSPRYRLSAEMLRDNVLAISGLLDSTIGGEPAKPYEVEVSFKPVGRDKGRGLYRRSIYTYWKRTGPAPMLTTLDAALRDVCRVKRDVTASPLQALVMFNSPQFVEAARVLAEDLSRRHQGDSPAMIGEVFRTLTSRHPSDAELQLLTELYDRQHARFLAEQAKAKQLLQIGDQKADASLEPIQVATMTSMVISLLNFDQSITKR